MAQAVQTSSEGGTGLSKKVRAIVTIGQLLGKRGLKALGLHASRKVEADFVATLQDVAPTTAINQLEATLHVVAAMGNDPTQAKPEAL